MARKATIVSFDEAKRTSRSSRGVGRSASTRMPGTPVSDRPLAYFDPGVGADFVSPFAQRDRQRSADGVRASSSSRPAASRRPASPASSRRAARPGSEAAAPQHARRSPSWYDGPNEQAVRDEAARRARVVEDAREIEDEVAGEKQSLKQKLAKAVAKRKADKLFGKQDGAPSGEGGPRAALYKGEMGVSQRRAQRMQGSDEPSSEGGRRAPKRRFRMGAKARIALASVACLALVCVFLYQPAQQCYQSMRHRDALAAEYAALQERDEALQSSVDVLSTDAGMEDMARDQFGLVKQGEVPVTVQGVQAESDEDASIPPNVASGSVKAPDTWYSGVLDPLFGVE